MAKRELPLSELPLTTTHSRRSNPTTTTTNNNVIHPVEMESSPPNGGGGGGGGGLPTTTPSPIIPYSQIKHFEKHYTWLIPIFIILNIIMFVITMYVNNCHKNSDSCIADSLGRFSFQPMKENPLLGPSSTTLQKMGALDVKKVVDKDQVWRLFTCIWLHGGVFHILANMLSLLVIGIRLEQEFGFVRIGIVYIIAGLGGSLLSGLFIQSNISVGASGALFGLLGSMLSELFTNWTIYANKFSVLVTLVVIIAINLAMGVLPHVDNFAHIGGFLSGFLLGFVLLMRPHFGWVSQRYALVGQSSTSQKPKFKSYQWIFCVISLILLIIWFIAGMIMLLRGVNLNDNCSWCHNLSCVETSLWNCNTESISCLSEELGNQITITCSNNNRTRTYMLADPSTTRIQGLCTELCR